MKNQLKKIKQNAMQRRLAISLAGARGGTRLLTNRATSVFLAADRKKAVREQALAEEAARFVAKLGELKGAYVKIGQMMALYGEYFLPKQVTNALHTLEHNSSSLEWETIEPVITKTLGKRYQELEVQHLPIAAASLAQVHRATSNIDGRKLIVKVQYPGVARAVESDFAAVLQMLRFLRRAQSGRDFEAWMQALKSMLVDEIDYAREHRMTARMASYLHGDERYLVPTIEARYSGPKMLTMNYLEGFEVTHKRVSGLSQSRRNALAKAMLELFFKEIFDWGLVQTDPNFGNYRIQLRTSTATKDKLVLLDFGAVQEPPPKFLEALRQTIIAAHQHNREEVVAGAIALNCLQAAQSDKVKNSFADFCILLLEPFREDHREIPKFALNSKNQYKWHESNLLRRVAKLGARSIAIDGFSSPPGEFTLIARKLTGVFTFVTALRAEINANKIINQYL